jgi:hypothetical protein
MSVVFASVGCMGKQGVHFDKILFKFYKSAVKGSLFLIRILQLGHIPIIENGWVIMGMVSANVLGLFTPFMSSEFQSLVGGFIFAASCFQNFCHLFMPLQ